MDIRSNVKMKMLLFPPSFLICNVKCCFQYKLYYPHNILSENVKIELKIFEYLIYSLFGECSNKQFCLLQCKQGNLL